MSVPLASIACPNGRCAATFDHYEVPRAALEKHLVGTPHFYAASVAADLTERTIRGEKFKRATPAPPPPPEPAPVVEVLPPRDEEARAPRTWAEKHGRANGHTMPPTMPARPQDERTPFVPSPDPSPQPLAAWCVLTLATAPKEPLMTTKKKSADPASCVLCTRFAPDKCKHHGGPSRSTSFGGKKRLKKRLATAPPPPETVGIGAHIAKLKELVAAGQAAQAELDAIREALA